MEPILATVNEISVSGISLNVETALAAGTPVNLDGFGIVASGIVRNCSWQGGSYRIGIELRPNGAEPAGNRPLGDKDGLSNQGAGRQPSPQPVREGPSN
ncbi:MAG: hypothetical protein JO323_16725 [Acidobacteriia bacterium]|nr:hypothetical protein [Terriglobia bacterium]